LWRKPSRCYDLPARVTVSLRAKHACAFRPAQRQRL